METQSEGRGRRCCLSPETSPAAAHFDFLVLYRFVWQADRAFRSSIVVEFFSFFTDCGSYPAGILELSRGPEHLEVPVTQMVIV